MDLPFSPLDFFQTVYMGIGLGKSNLKSGDILVTKEKAQRQYAALQLLGRTKLEGTKYEVYETSHPGVYVKIIGKGDR